MPRMQCRHGLPDNQLFDPENAYFVPESNLLLQKLSNSLLTVVGHAGGGFRDGAFFDGEFDNLRLPYSLSRSDMVSLAVGLNPRYAYHMILVALATIELDDRIFNCR